MRNPSYPHVEMIAPHGRAMMLALTRRESGEGALGGVLHIVTEEYPFGAQLACDTMAGPRHCGELSCRSGDTAPVCKKCIAAMQRRGWKAEDDPVAVCIAESVHA
jgi:hypothetical protein